MILFFLLAFATDSKPVVAFRFDAVTPPVLAEAGSEELDAPGLTFSTQEQLVIAENGQAKVWSYRFNDQTVACLSTEGDGPNEVRPKLVSLFETATGFSLIHANGSRLATFGTNGTLLANTSSAQTYTVFQSSLATVWVEAGQLKLTGKGGRDALPLFPVQQFGPTLVAILAPSNHLLISTRSSNNNTISFVVADLNSFRFNKPITLEKRTKNEFEDLPGPAKAQMENPKGFFFSTVTSLYHAPGHGFMLIEYEMTKKEPVTYLHLIDPLSGKAILWRVSHPKLKSLGLLIPDGSGAWTGFDSATNCFVQGTLTRH